MKKIVLILRILQILGLYLAFSEMIAKNISANNLPNYSFGINNRNISYIRENLELQVALNQKLGELYVPKYSKKIDVFEGENLENMKIGASHFQYTPVFDGNVVMAGHNRGSSGYFSFVKDLELGDILKYTIDSKTRTYKVSLKEKVNENDFTYLLPTDDNKLTLITCVENEPKLRLVVQLINEEIC